MSRPDIDLVAVARRVLEQNGFVPDPPPGIEATLPAEPPTEGARDLRRLLWTSIDNKESRDLDQLEYAEPIADGRMRLLVAIADVDALVPKGSPIDDHAATNTASLYTGMRTFPMLPELLAFGRTSLLPEHDRLAVVTEMIVHLDGSLDDAATTVYRGLVRNHAKLVYERVGELLEGPQDSPGSSVEEQIALQARVTMWLRKRRIEAGALELDTIEARPIAKDGRIIDLQVIRKSRARELIEDLMIATNGATARFLERRVSSSIRRVVRAPKRWDRIVEIARVLGSDLPVTPSVRALGAFVAKQRREDPERFHDFSLTIVKLLGPGEYVLQRPTDPDSGHFGLAVDDYLHSTAPNRRYSDLVTQRLLKAAAAGLPAPYSDDELLQIAARCTERENALRKVERTLRKITAAVLLNKRIGDRFEAIVTGVTQNGTFARLLKPPAEGRIIVGERGLDVGDRVKVKLVATDVERGFLDFAVAK